MLGLLRKHQFTGIHGRRGDRGEGRKTPLGRKNRDEVSYQEEKNELGEMGSKKKKISARGEKNSPTPARSQSFLTKSSKGDWER